MDMEATKERPMSKTNKLRKTSGNPQKTRIDCPLHEIQKTYIIDGTYFVAAPNSFKFGQIPYLTERRGE